MFYQVDIYRKASKGHGIHALNLSGESLEDRVLGPYRQGSPITLSGTTIHCSEISRIRIMKTDEDINNLQDTYKLILQSDGFTYSRSEQDVTDEFITDPPGSEIQKGSADGNVLHPPVDTREVFVVHGRNLAARDALFEFLRAVDLHPLEWSEAIQATGKATPYVGEILDVAFSRAGAVVVLFSPDDEARLRKSLWAANDPPHETQLSGQARPNVLFEAGMAMARSQDRTILIELGNLRPFSDIGGRHTVRLDNSSQRRQELAQRLATAGCPVNREGTDWHTAGNFEDAVAEENDNLGPRDEQPPEFPTTPPISDDARELLLDAARSADNTIVAYKVMAGLAIHIGDRFFAEPGDRRSEARWKRAIEELEQAGLVEALSNKRQAFQLTHAGFAMADALNESQKEILTEPP